MEIASNVLTDGLNLDTHPLMQNQKVMTDALNATWRTYNGNEMVLQNDMGNTTIQDSLTGNIIQLSDGFIPVGMKEHGGVLYIASYNPKTEKGELGSIPSPLISYEYFPGITKSLEVKAADISENSSVLDEKILNKYIKLSDIKYSVGDQFIVELNIKKIDETLEKNHQYELSTYTKVKFPKISKINEYGLYKIQLWSLTSSGEIELDYVYDTAQTWYNKNGDQKTSDYWFINSSDVPQLDIEKSQNECYRTYPNMPSGYLAIKIVPETIEDFSLLVNRSTGIKQPLVFKKSEKYEIVNSNIVFDDKKKV